MRVKLPKVHPKVTLTKAKHTAAFLTITGGSAHYVPALAPYEAIIFMLAGCIAIYIDDIVHVFHLCENAIEEI